MNAEATEICFLPARTVGAGCSIDLGPLSKFDGTKNAEHRLIFGVVSSVPDGCSIDWNLVPLENWRSIQGVTSANRSRVGIVGHGVSTLEQFPFP